MEWQLACFLFVCLLEMVSSDCGKYNIKFYRLGHNPRYHTFCSDVCVPWINSNYKDLCWDNLETRTKCSEYVTCLTATTTKLPQTSTLTPTWFTTMITTQKTMTHSPESPNYLLLIGVPVLSFIIIIAIFGFILYKCGRKCLKRMFNTYSNHYGNTVIENKDNIPEGQELMEIKVDNQEGERNMEAFADPATKDRLDEHHKQFSTAATVRGKQVQAPNPGKLYATPGSYPSELPHSYDTIKDNLCSDTQPKQITPE
ncbi:unnamed protein product [Owenia fusiformis]|uniref:Uncharacterized protein n=1 Tax=Owenia fusiformis TaxID=6347 RepID=A0A8J1TEJ5_OWEFU|nr:unnamed protein product [Owenia fusiformis]